MSGDDPVFLHGAQGDRLVATLHRLVQARPQRDYAVVGGVAVAVRVGRMHRGTSDVDTVIDERQLPATVEVLAAGPDTRVEETPANTARVYIGGTKLELIPVGFISPGDTDDRTDKQTLFVEAHAYALASATLTRIASQSIAAPVTAPFATEAALLAMKLHAFSDRSMTSGVDKQASDAADMYQLLVHCAPQIVAAAPTLPAALRDAMRTAATTVLVDRAARTAAKARASEANVGDLTGEVLAGLALPVIAALTPPDTGSAA